MPNYIVRGAYASPVVIDDFEIARRTVFHNLIRTCERLLDEGRLAHAGDVLVKARAVLLWEEPSAGVVDEFKRTITSGRFTISIEGVRDVARTG